MNIHRHIWQRDYANIHSFQKRGFGVVLKGNGRMFYCTVCGKEKVRYPNPNK